MSAGLLLAALLASGCTGLPAMNAGGSRWDALDAELAAVALDPSRPLASLSVLAIRDGRIAYSRQFGARHIDRESPAKGRPANDATLYRIASVSKLVTALGVMRMVESGRLDLDRDVGEVLGYPFRNPNFPQARITLRMLLGHTSSLRDDGGYSWEAKHDIGEALQPGGRLFGEGAAWARNAGPGEYFQYCNLNWGVIATVMERASGERFDRLMRRLVLDPLGLRGGFNPAEFAPEDLDNLATLYRKRPTADDAAWDSPGPWIAQVDDYSRAAPVPRTGPDYAVGANGTAYGPQGNIRLSAAGLGTIMLMLMNAGSHGGTQFLRPGTIDAMLAVHWRRDAAGSNGGTAFGRQKDFFNAWGLGAQLFTDRSGPGFGDRLVEGGGFTGAGHRGDAYGLTAVFAFDRALRNGMILLTGGPGFDPATDPGTYSSQHRHEERILTALYRRAILGINE